MFCIDFKITFLSFPNAEQEGYSPHAKNWNNIPKIGGTFRVSNFCEIGILPHFDVRILP